ncbi:DNA internalization-related competence protein ComEC/Rec2 [Bacillus sp. MUM 116]|uniref:DNA internalization-related competence protein ComEC/Rec2 n=1 Tax=Bacillus sp. MUM 116 TaxID=1678002 RepID=UPI0008F58244|nr:DNA internalization-related competence protein ComEC/Rec2 [Bacillus sp. MUM 116]OIK16619.1 DNA internalization-related competence protein ComEC/Rec2 [Bacillus sp. MUM 116]
MKGKYVYFAISAILGVLSSLIMFVPFFMTAVIFIFLIHTYKKYSSTHLLLLIGCFLLFFLSARNAKIDNQTIIPATTNIFYIEYLDETKIDGDLLQVVVKEKNYKEKLLLRYRFHSEAEKETIKKINFYGKVCKVSGELSKPSIAKNPNAFNYREYLTIKKIYWIVEVGSNPLQACIPQKKSPLIFIKQLRFLGIHYLDTHFPPKIASLSAALIFGDRSLIDPELLANYQKTGIVHLLAISGLHVSLLIGMVYYLGIRSGFTRQFMTRLLLFLLPIYAILTGGSPSVIRSVLMIFLILLTVTWKSKLKLLPIDSISLAIILYLLFNPMVIFDIGFQLSFTVSFAIIISAQIILKQYENSLAIMLATSIIAQFAALPLLLYHYFGASLISIAANMLYIPLFSFVFMPGLYVLFFIQIIFQATPAILITFFIKIITLSNQLIGYLSNFSIALIVPGRPGILFLIIYIAVILVVFLVWESPPYYKKILHIVLLTGFMMSFQTGWNWINPVGEVTMIDVGQGDSIFIHLPFGKGNYLIDTGGTVSFLQENWRKRKRPHEVGRDVVVPFLKGKGITKIDKLILTHGDMDHIGGTFSILKEIKVEQILMPSVKEPSETELEIIHEAKRKGISVIKVSKDMQWKNGEHLFYVLSPEKNFVGERNSGSVTIFAKIGGLTWFFGGDLDKEGEERVIRDYPKLTVDILKAGHHGSKTSSGEAFIQQIKPKVALISAGEKNRFGHPHKETMEILKKYHVLIYRTDHQGAITYHFYHGHGTFTTFLP